jgi:hypothetical protein
VNGLQRAIKLFTQNHPEIGRRWKPKIEYLLSINRMLDRFGAEAMYKDQPVVREVKCPVCIFNTIMSDRVFDFILYPFHPKNARGLRGTRMIMLKDDNDYAHTCLDDMIQFIFSLTYGYVFGIPFQNGGLAQPAPIKYSKKYAESFTQLIMSSDKTLDDLRLSEKLHRPHVITNLLPLPDLTDPLDEDDVLDKLYRA